MLCLRFPRLLQPSWAAELRLLLAECSSCRTLTKYRKSTSLYLQRALDRMANKNILSTALQDLAMQDFRRVACDEGVTMIRDALLDEIFHPQPQRE